MTDMTTTMMYMELSVFLEYRYMVDTLAEIGMLQNLIRASGFSSMTST